MTPSQKPSGFTLVEVLVSMSLLAYLMIILFAATDAASQAWRTGQSRTDAFQSGRTTLEIMAREISPAVVDTRMQFVVAPGGILSKAGAPKVAETAPAVLWMAPIGENGSLRCVGYYLSRDPERKAYRLKRLTVGSQKADGTLSPYFPRVANQQDPANPHRLIDPRDATQRPSPVDAGWFTRNWNSAAFDEERSDNARAIVSSAADGVIALWVQTLDQLGEPVPLLSRARNHPTSDLAYNSAAYFEMASASEFTPGRSFLYLAETPLTPRANRLPQAVEITIATLDHATLLRTEEVPEQTNQITTAGALDVEGSIAQLRTDLHAINVHNPRLFTTRVRLINGN